MGSKGRKTDLAENHDKEREFTRAELAEKNGADGRPVYIAYQGKVYDVSGSSLWAGGRHMDLHQAGHELTGEFAEAPHGEEVLERYPQVGIIREETAEDAPEAALSPAREFWLRVLKRLPLLRRHPHPMLVHFPIVFMIATTVFTLLYLVTGVKSFEVTGFHCLGGGVLFTPVAMATGAFTWWLNYEAQFFRPVVIKLVLSPILLLVGAGAFAWRLLNPEILASLSHWPSLVYLALICSLTPLVGIIGACGAELTFPRPHE
jgi:predicted heme/steroid binding protein/uncharacterized membrane protein